MRAAVPSVPAVLCGSVGLLLLLLRWRRWRGLWRKVKEARERQERGLEQMDKAVRAFRQQVGAGSCVLHDPSRVRVDEFPGPHVCWGRGERRASFPRADAVPAVSGQVFGCGDPSSLSAVLLLF